MAKLISKPVNTYRSTPQNIKFLITNPCAANPYVYFETLGPVLGKAVIELLTFGLSDVLIGYARPKIPRSRLRFGRTIRRRLFGRDGRKRPIRPGFELPETGNEIGKRLPFAERVQSLTDNKIGHLLWLPVDILERGLYWWMIADITKDSIYEWASDIYKDTCPQPKFLPAWATYDAFQTAMFFHGFPTWNPGEAGLSSKSEQHGMTRSGYRFNFFGNKTGYIYLYLDGMTWLFGTTGKFRIIVQQYSDFTGTKNIIDFTKTFGKGENITYSAKGRITQAKAVQIFVSPLGGSSPIWVSFRASGFIDLHAA